MEYTLEQNEIELLLDRLPGMLYRCRYDKDWTMEFLSDGCEELTGYKKEDMLYNKKTTYASLIAKNDSDMVYEAVTKALNENRPFSYEYKITTKNGSLKWVWEQGEATSQMAIDILFLVYMTKMETYFILKALLLI